MAEHRKGLNRTLFWLYSGNGQWPSVFRWSMLVFDLVTIGIFLVHPLVSWHRQDVPPTGIWIVVDVFIATVIGLDFLARFYIERHKVRFFLRPTNWADLIVFLTMVLPVLAANFSFLRVLRVVRLVRAFEYIDHKAPVARWLDVEFVCRGQGREPRRLHLPGDGAGLCHAGRPQRARSPAISTRSTSRSAR